MGLVTTLPTPAAPVTTIEGDIAFTQANVPQGLEENILFQTPESGSIISGATNQTNVTFFFQSLTGQTLYQVAQGQADITSVNGPPSGSALTSVKITAGPGVGWTDFIMNPLNATSGSVATVTVKDSLNNVYSYDIGNGQNYLTMVENVAHEAITEIDLTVAGGSFTEFKQPRVSGVCTLTSAHSCDPIPTPEPAAIALMGIGLFGLGMVKYKGRKSIAV